MAIKLDRASSPDGTLGKIHENRPGDQAQKARNAGYPCDGLPKVIRQMLVTSYVELLHGWLLPRRLVSIGG